MATAYESQLAESIEEYRQALIEYPGDPRMTAEIRRLEFALEEQQSKPRKFITAAGRDRAAIDNYLGFGAQIVESSERKRGGLAAIIEVPAEHADWQSQRLASGLMGGGQFDSLAEAREMLAIVVDLG